MGEYNKEDFSLVEESHENRSRQFVSRDVPGYVVVPLESFPLDTIMPINIFLQVAANMVLFRGIGDLITSTRANSLRGKGADCVYLQEEDWKKYLGFLENQTASLDFSIPLSDLSATRLRFLLAAYSKQLTQRHLISANTFQRTQEITFKLAEGLHRDASLGQRILRRYRDPLVYTANHPVNVCIYSCCVASKLKLSLESMRVLSLAAFLHDVGNVFVPPEVLKHPGGLTPDERFLLRDHTQKGSALLQNIYKNHPEIHLTAEQHHERFDGTGYPHKLKGESIELFARLIKIGDVFDALSSPRTCFPEPFTPQGAIELMQHMTGKFDPNLFQMASEFML